MPWFCHPEPPGVRNWLPQNSEIPTDLRSTSVYTVGPYQTTLPHCFLIPATKTFSLTPVPLKLLSNTCFSSFFFKGLNGLITQSHSCRSRTTWAQTYGNFSQIRHYLNGTDIVWSSARQIISTKTWFNLLNWSAFVFTMFWKIRLTSVWLPLLSSHWLYLSQIWYLEPKI